MLNVAPCGKRKLFIVGLSNDLIELETTNCVSLEIDGPISFTESSQLLGFKFACWFNVVAYLPFECGGWRLGILQAIHALVYSNQIKLFEWIGPVKNAGTPNFIHDKIFSVLSNISQHFNYREFSVDS